MTARLASDQKRIDYPANRKPAGDGRDEAWRERIKERALDLMAEGKTLPAAVAFLKAEQPELDCPNATTIYRWTIDDVDFAQRFARARKAQEAIWESEVIDISDEAVRDAAQATRQRTRIDSRKWLLSKRNPDVYGDKVALDGGSSSVGALFAGMSFMLVKQLIDAAKSRAANAEHPTLIEHNPAETAK